MNLLGARTESIIAVRSPIEIGPDTVIRGDVMALDSLVHQTGFTKEFDMKVLVCAASRHGATSEIAKAIADALTTEGIEAEVRLPEDVETLAGYDGIVLGSGVYAGRWLGPVRQLIERESATLATKPVWLFSSGPLGDPLKPEQDPEDVELLLKRTRALGHRTFAGKIDRRELGIAEKTILADVRATEGDFRPWPAISQWASDIAGAMRTRAGGGAIA